EEKQVEELSSGLKLHHLILREGAELLTFGGPIVYSSGGRAVTAARPPFAVPNQYMLLVESPVVDDSVSEDREALISLDESFKELQGTVFSRCARFVANWKANHAHEFIESARKEKYYPFSVEAKNSLEEVE